MYKINYWAVDSKIYIQYLCPMISLTSPIILYNLPILIFINSIILIINNNIYISENEKLYALPQIQSKYN